jgi:hypothetical protein
MKPFYPARLTAEEVAERLGMKKHDIPILVRYGLLKPLGKPEQQSVKYFAAVEIEEKAANAGWLGKATDALYRYWRQFGGKSETK